MHWLGSYLQNLVTYSDKGTPSAGHWSVISGTLGTWGSALAFPPRETRQAGDVEFFPYFAATGSEAAVSACGTVTVSSGTQLVATTFMHLSGAAGLYMQTPHGRVGMVFSWNGTFAYSSDNSSAYAYLETDMPEAILEYPNDWYRLKLSLRARSTGAYAPALFRRRGNDSPVPGLIGPLYATQVIVGAVNTVANMPPYASTSGTPYSGTMDGVFVAPTDVTPSVKRAGAQHATRSGAQFRYSWGFFDNVTVRLENLDPRQAATINSLWADDSTVIFADGIRIREVWSGTITNPAKPISVREYTGDSVPFTNRSGLIQLESF